MKCSKTRRKQLINGMKKLTFEQLRKANAKRCAAYFHPVNEWSETDYGCALAGEVGELCNFLKKRRRNLEETENHREDCKKELGDVIAYADLVATRLGLKLEDCIRDKFNEVSKRKKCKIKL